ncbi:hypothetical protein LV457_02950 [Mycobacterium sp. MYCO198283]|uniref:phage upper tail fiber protein n=1 Tax=Mycobacterium sp. MYCO198283 TaxID=2883505 RepID=UPI001E31A852|nr:hypothetical protein [Mycobacterium sp. MYCO198283]MCG5431248.1 hypothetical protein [Mycobacterium sp. MYCO198283]
MNTVEAAVALKASASDVSAKYTKPPSGIPSTDLATSVQAALVDTRTPTVGSVTFATLAAALVVTAAESIAANSNDATIPTSAAVAAAISAAVNGLVNGAPGTLDTIKEVADALGNDPNAVTTLTGLIAAKYTKPVGGIPLTDLAAAVQTTIDGKYVKPVGGIPSSDLSAAVQTLLTAAGTALQAVPANSVGNAQMQDDAVGIDELSASGTPDTTKFLRGDNVWAVPPAGGGGGSGVDSLDDLGVTASAAELNILDGATLTTQELNYVDGVTGPIQTQIDGKAAAAHTHGVADVTGAVSTANRNQPNGYAGLDGTGKVAAAQLPSYVDDVLEYANTAAFPATGEAGKIYVATDTGKTYRWGGSAYAVISDTIALGTTAGTAKPGDWKPAAADVTDSTVTGRAVLTAADAAAARSAIGAGTSNLAIGTTGATAAAGNDPRLSDARTPAAHTHLASHITDLTEAIQDTVAASLAQGANVTITYDDPSGAITIAASGGGGARTVATISTATTLAATAGTEYIYLLASGAVPTLPTAAGNTSKYTIKNTTAGQITLATTSSQTIDGATSYTLLAREAIEVVSDGSNWWIIGRGAEYGLWGGTEAEYTALATKPAKIVYVTT